MKKRILSLVMVFCLLGTLLPGGTLTASAATQSGTCGKNLTWTYDDSSWGILTISGTGDMDSWTAIKQAPWYGLRNSVTEIRIESGVTSIGTLAFNGFTEITELNIPDTVADLGINFVLGCTNLKEMIVSDDNPYFADDENGSVLSKDKTTFIKYPPGRKGTYSIPNTVTTIGEDAFMNCTNLSGIAISSNATTIGHGAFYGCSNLGYVTIPDSVLTVGDDAFYGCSKIVRLTIGNSVTSIGEWAFGYCTGLTSVTIPGSVKTIGYRAFTNCDGLTNVVMGRGVTTIGTEAFNRCDSLMKLTIPDSVTSIGKSAFSGCGMLTEITIPDSVTSLGLHAFDHCYSLKKVWAAEGSTRYSNDENGVLFNKDKTTVVLCPRGLSGEYSIPYGVTSIGEGAFGSCVSLTRINIPDTVTSIGNYAFSLCEGVTNFAIPNSVLTIGNSAFSYNSGLTSITIGNGVTDIGDSAFGYCSALTSITIPDSVISIGTEAFVNCTALTSIVIPGNVKSVGSNAFSRCSGLNSVTISEGVESIGKSAFSNCNGLSGIVIPSSVEFIGGGAFSYCPTLITIVILSSRCEIEWSNTYTLGREDTTVYGMPGSTAEEFAMSSAPKFVPLTEELCRTGEHCYVSGGCFLCGEHQIVRGTCGEGAYWVLDTIDGTLTISGEGDIFDYENTTDMPWYPYHKSIKTVIIGDAITRIGSYAFYSCDRMTSITFGSGVTSIGDYAFANCLGLTSLPLGESISTIGNYAFTQCDGLTSLTIGGKDTIIGKWAFRYCTGLTSVVLEDSVSTIDQCAFQYCYALKTVDTGDGVTDIGKDAFRDCHELESVIIGNSVRMIGDYSFCDCRKLESVIVGDSVTTIGDNAFHGCTELKRVALGSSVTTIGYSAFYECSKLASITIPKSVTIIEDSAFRCNKNLRHIHFIGNMPKIGNAAFYDTPREKTFYYMEGTRGWDDCSFNKALWDYTYTTDCSKFTCTCNTCGEVYSYESEDAHRWEVVAEVVPTCTAGGYVNYACLDCGKTKTITADSFGHEMGELIDKTGTYLVYTCLNGNHNYILHRDSRIATMMLDGVGASFVSEEDYHWILCEDSVEVGRIAIKSSNRGRHSTTSASTITFFSARDFTLSFSYIVSSEIDSDKLTIQLDDATIVDGISGEITGDYTSNTLPAGTHRLILTYTKDDIGSYELDSGYLYNIVAQAVQGDCVHSNITAIEAKTPGCVEAGNIAYRYCPDCEACFFDKELTKEIFKQDTLIPAKGHTPVYAPKNEEYHTVGCENCTVETEEPHSFVDGVCVCGAMEAKEPVLMDECRIGHTLNLASDISVTFAVEKTILEGFDMDTVYLISKVDAYEGNVYVGERTFKIRPVEKGNLYYFTLTGLTAVNMNDGIHSVLYGTKDGQEYYSERDDYSIAEYAYGQLERANTAEGLKRLCANLLQYGAYAQRYKNYRTDYLVDASMTEAYKAFLRDLDTVAFGKNNVVQEDLKDPEITWAAKALDLASKVTLKLIFSPGNYTGNIEELSLRLTFTGVDGKTVSAEIQGAELYNANYGIYAFSFDGLLAAELRTVISAQIYEGDTPVSCTMQYSADTYGNNMTGALGDLCKALFAYSDSAKEYFA